MAMSDDPSTDHDQRERLFDRARVGEITGDEADAEAIQLGLGSLSSRPGPEAFRPEAMADWTLPMTLAWIVYLDLDTVRDWHAPYRAECWHWMHQKWRVGFDGPVHTGWLLEQRLPPTLSLFGTSVSVDRVDGEGPQPTMSAREARESLWAMLREGFLKASGFDLSTGRRREIPPLEWHELVPVEGHGEVDEVRHGLLGEGYRDVLLPSAPVRSYWHKKDPALDRLPDLMPPTGFGYMPLYCAAQWIATEGGQRHFDPTDVAQWRPAYRDLLEAISSEAVRIVGVSDHRTIPVPPYLFAGIRVEHPHEEMDLDTLFSDELVLRSYPYVDEEHWLKGGDDALVDRRGDRWSRLMVEKSDVRTLWQFAATPQTSTGLPGRPALSRHLIDDELQRRGLANELEGTLREQAGVLVAWLRVTYPKHQPPKPRVVENNIRVEYHRLKGMK